MVTCYFIGAGPGELELLTLKAKRILEKADYVFYDQLIPALALDYCPDNCKKISVSKLSPVKTKQSLINQKILGAFTDLTKRKKREGIIVRLKGGDPSIFARIKEEIAFVKENKIPFEVIPGISSFYTAAMYAGIPLTARGISSNFSVLTGHFDNPEKKLKIIKASDTTVYLMGIKNLAKIIELNLASGKSPKTPVAIIEKGTLSEQRVVTGTLATIASKAEKEKIAHPGIIIIGKVVHLRKKLTWYEEKKLFHKKIAIFKAPQDLIKLHDLIVENGGKVLSYPLLQFKKITTYEKELVRVIHKGKLKAIIFTSTKAVQRFFAIILSSHFDIKAISHYTIIVVGEYTAKTLSEYHIKADYVATPANQEGVWQIIQKNKINHILFPRSAVVRDFLEKKLVESKINFTALPLYTHITKKITRKALQEILNLDFLIFTSPLMVRAFKENLKVIKNSNPVLPPFLSLGKITHQEVVRCFSSAVVKKAYYPDKSDFSSLVEKLLKII